MLPLFLFCNSNNGICSKYIHKSSFNKLIETLINDSKIVLDAYLCIYNNNEIGKFNFILVIFNMKISIIQ